MLETHLGSHHKKIYKIRAEHTRRCECAHGEHTKAQDNKTKYTSKQKAMTKNKRKITRDTHRNANIASVIKKNKIPLRFLSSLDKNMRIHDIGIY